MQDEPLSFRTDKHALLANVALMYFGEGLTQNDIAKRLQVSRATVVNMLREARESGIVDIRVDGRSLAASNLGLDLRLKYGLEDVYVAQSDMDGTTLRADMLRQLGRVGAVALADMVRREDRLGVAWGETVHALSQHVPRAAISGVKVYQMIGSKMSESVPTSESCAIAIANMLGATCYTLHAPAIASSAKVAAMFRAEPTICTQLDALSRLDMVVASIGNVSAQTHLARAQMVSAEELAAARKAGAVGILCCRFIDADGNPLRLPPDDRLISTELDNIRRADRRLLVVGGADRADAVKAAIRGGYASHLCVDRALALELLR
jgi:DNA-binding transcriptional regulator LsrR (DeoR family)